MGMCVYIPVRHSFMEFPRCGLMKHSWLYKYCVVFYISAVAINVAGFLHMHRLLHKLLLKIQTLIIMKVWSTIKTNKLIHRIVWLLIKILRYVFF